MFSKWFDIKKNSLIVKYSPPQCELFELSQLHLNEFCTLSSIPECRFFSNFDRECSSRADFRSCDRFSIGFNLDFDSAITKHKPSFQAIPFVVFSQCYGWLSCWNVLYINADCSRFTSAICLYLVPSIPFCLWWQQAFQVLLLKVYEHDTATTMLDQTWSLCFAIFSLIRSQSLFFFFFQERWDFPTWPVSELTSFQSLSLRGRICEDLYRWCSVLHRFSCLTQFCNCFRIVAGILDTSLKIGCVARGVSLTGFS